MRGLVSRQLLGVVLSLDIALQPLWALAADGAVPSTAANGATQVSQAPNGVEVINIADPNAAGVSHNLFQEYQVGTQGQVLNNSTGEVRSKLAGTIEGNSQLQHGPASIIVNEVTGANPSSLLGVTEVAGQAASLVIANPNGITCSGCGFLNTPRVTLGTGRPLWQEGQLTGLAVDTGILEIGQEGLLGGNLEKLELLAKQIVLYGQVISPDLTLAAGSLRFNYANGSVEQRGVLPGSLLPQFAIDASALGAMYANKIALVATDNGVGVNVEGPMAAYTGSIRIDANGEVRASDVQAQQTLIIETEGKVTLNKALANSVDINTAEAVQLNGTLAAQEQLSVQAKSIHSLGTVSAGYRPDGALNNGASLRLTTKGKADNQGQWLSAGSLSVTAGDLTNRLGAMISGRESLSLTANTGSNRGELNSLGALTLTIDGLWDNQGGRVQTAGQLTLSADVWNNRQGHVQAANISAQLGGSLNNTQGEVVTTHGSVFVDAAELINQQGVLQSQGAVKLTATNLDNTQGSLTARGGEASTISLDGALTNGGGTVAIASSQANINAKTLDQTAKAAGQAGGTVEFTGAGASQIQAEQIINTGGKIAGTGESLTLKAQTLNNQNGTVRSGHLSANESTKAPAESAASTTAPAATASQLSIELEGELNNRQGRVLSDNLTLSAATLDNRAGYIDAQSTQGTTLITINGDVQNQGGTLLTKQHDLSLQAQNWQNAQGQIGHLGSGVFTFNAQQVENTAGKVQTFGSAQWQLGGWDNTQGVVSIRGDGDANSAITLSEDWINEQGRLLVGGNDLTVTARGLYNNSLDDTQGVWHSGSGIWALTAKTLTNTAGKIGSAGDFKLTLNQLENAGQIDARTLKLVTNTATNNGQITLSDTAANSLDADVQGDWINQKGKITLAGGGLITANRWDNTDGQLLAAGSIALTAKGGNTNQASFINQNGWLQADRGLTLTTGSTLDNARGKLLSGGETVLSSQAGINNTGGTIDLTPAATTGTTGTPESTAPSFTITAQGVLDNTQGTLQSFSQGQHTLSASHINNTQGLIYSDAQTLTANVGRVDNTAGRWQHTGQTLTVNGLDEWVNKANTDTAALLHTDGTLVIQGFNRLLNDGQVGEAPSTIRARSAQLQGKRVENLNGAQLALVATEKPGTEIPTSEKPAPVQPVTATTGSDASATPQALANLPPVESSLQLGQLVNQGRIFTQASLNLSEANLLNTGGEFSSFSDLTLNAGDLANLGGKLWADGILTLTSAGDFTFANQAQLDAGRGVVWDVKGAFTNQGTLASGTDLTLKANAFANTADADLSALGTLALEVTQALTNEGRIRGSSSTQVQANSLENHGLISAQHDLNVTVGASITNTNTLFAAGDLTALAPELFNTSTATTTASIWAGGKLILAGGKASDGATPLVGKQLINTSGSIQTYQAGDIELRFNQVTNQADKFALTSELIQVKQWFTTGSGKPDDAIENGEFDLTIGQLLGLMQLGRNQVPFIEHHLYAFQPAAPVRQPRITSGGALLIQTLNEPTAVQRECAGLECAPALIRNLGGSISAVGDLTLESGFDPTASIVNAGSAGSRVDNSNLFLPGKVTQEPDLFLRVTPDPGVDYSEIARFDNLGTLTQGGAGDVTTRPVEKASTLHTGTIIAGGTLTAHVEKVENSEKAAYQAKWTGPAITGEAPPSMDFSQGSPFSRVALSNTDSTQVKATERTALDPTGANSDGLGSTDSADITSPVLPQEVQTQAREARIYNPLQNLVLPNNGYLYRVDIKGSSPYVVQAADLLKPPSGTPNPDKPATSSDYFFTQLGYDPEQIGRRLGDSFYETELVRQAVMETRGVRFVTDPRTGLAIDSDEAQYRYLLDNALEAQKDLQLAVGTALTPEQVRALTQDIVWLERHEMAGQEVWVPVYYATGVDPSQMANGAVMAGQAVRVVSEELLNRGDIRGLSLVDVNSQKSQNFGAIGSLDRLIVKSQNLENKGLLLGKTTQVTGFDIDNSGQMIARETLDVTADNELKNRGELAGTDVNAKSTSGDLINQGRINASNNTDLDAGRDIVLQPGQAAGVNTGGNLTAKAGRDFKLEGQTLNTQGDASISASRDVTITPTTQRSLTSGGHTNTEVVTHTATRITTAGSLSIDAGRDIGITATKIDTGKNLSLHGERDVTLTSAADRTHTEGQGKNWHHIETDVKQVTTDIKAGGNIDATAGRDLTMVAVQGKADGDIHLNGKRDTNLLSAVDSQYDYDYEKKKKSFGRSKTTESESLKETAVTTDLSAGGNLLLNVKLDSQGKIIKEEGERVNTTGAHLSAGKPATQPQPATPSTAPKPEVALDAAAQTAGTQTLAAAENEAPESSAPAAESSAQTTESSAQTSESSAQPPGSAPTPAETTPAPAKSGRLLVYAADSIAMAGQTTKTIDYSESRRSGTLGLSQKAKGSQEGKTHQTGTTLSSAADTRLLSDGDLTLEGVVGNINGDLTLSAVDHLRVAPGQTSEHTQTWNSKSGAFSGGSLYRTTEHQSDEGANKLTESSLLINGSLNIEAGSGEILGTRIQTGNIDQIGNFTFTTDSGDLLVGAAQASSYSKDSTLDLRLKGADAVTSLKAPHKIIQTKDGRATIQLGGATYLNADNAKSELTQQVSQVTTYGDISLDAAGPIGSTSVAGSVIEATGVTNLHGTQRLALASVEETSTERHKTQEGKGELSVVGQNQAVEIAKATHNLEEAKEQLSQAKRNLSQFENNIDTQQSQLDQLRADLAAGTPGVDTADIERLDQLVRDLKDERARYASGLALAAANLASASTALIQQTGAGAASIATLGFNVGLQADISAQENTSETKRSTSIGSIIRGDIINLTTGTRTTDGTTTRYNTANTQIDMQGADVEARAVTIRTGQLNAEGRVDTEQTSSRNRQAQVSSQITVYGGTGGASVNGSYQQAESGSQSTTVHNTRIQADHLTLITSGDANLKGAITRAEESLVVEVEGDLTLDSQQNRSSSTSDELGVSGGVGIGGDGTANKGNAFTRNIQTGSDLGSTNSTNGGINQGTSRTRTQETVVTSLTSGGTAEINVKGNTHLGGATLGTLERVDVCADKNSKACKNDYVFGRDLNQLTFTTGSLTYNDLTNQTTTISNSFALSTNLSQGEGQDGQAANPRLNPNTAKTAKGDELSPTSSTISLANSNHNTATKTLSTLGHGNITVGGVELEKDGTLTAAGTDAAKSGVLKGLNRDTENTEKALWDSHQDMQVDASVDHRLFTKEGHEQIKKDYEDAKDGATALIRPIDKRIDGFDNREADRAREKIRSELTQKYSKEVADYFIEQGEASGLFTNIGKINSGFYNSADQTIDTLIALQLPGAIDNSIPNVVSEAIPGQMAEVKVTAPKDISLGVVVSNTTADLARIINEVPEDRKNAANDFYTLLTGGPFGFVTNKAIEKGVSLLPQPVLQSMGDAGEKFNETIGRAGTGVLLGVSQDQVKESQASGNERTQDRVDGAAMVGGAALDVTVGVVVGGVAIAVSKAKAKKARGSDQNGNAESHDSNQNCNGDQCEESDGPEGGAANTNSSRDEFAGPYNPNKTREDLEATHGAENVISTTNPNNPRQTVNSNPDEGIEVIHGADGGKAIRVQYNDPVTGQPSTANIPYNDRGLPIFDDHAKFTTNIDKTKTYESQFTKATRDLREAIINRTVDQSQFTSLQLKQIQSGKGKIDGYTWHHNADGGNMQLVPEKVHDAVKHIGQQALDQGK